MDNTPVEKVDIMSYAGKWYTLYSIPTQLSKKWYETTETYVIHPDGYFAVFTTYKIEGDDNVRYIRSKLFVVRGTANAEMKAQYIWPVKIDYWVIELAEDYSYAVIGHPKNKYLTILSRKTELPKELIDEIIQRCEEKGYNTSKLIAQGHKPAVLKGHAHS